MRKKGRLVSIELTWVKSIWGIYKSEIKTEKNEEWNEQADEKKVD